MSNKFIPSKGMYFIITGQKKRINSNIVYQHGERVAAQHSFVYGHPGAYMIYYCEISTQDLIKARAIVDLEDHEAIYQKSITGYFPAKQTDFIQVDPEIMKDCAELIDKFEKDFEIGDHTPRSGMLLLPHDIVNEFQSGMIGENNEALKEILRIASKK